MNECMIRTKKSFPDREHHLNTIIDMEKRPFRLDGDSSKSAQDSRYDYGERKALYQRLRFWVGTILFSAFSLLTSIS